jgi:pSer/pThr/pTyr-binding forkhead associated (FHA) protein
MKIFSKYTIVIEFEGRRIQETVTKESFIIGRSADCDLPIESKNLSRQHLKVLIVGGDVYIEDLKSTNGCFLDGAQVEPGKPVLYSKEKTLTLGKHEDVSLIISAQFEDSKSLVSQTSFQENPAVSVKEVKGQLNQIFSKDPLSLDDPPPKKAERDYKEIMNQVEILKTEIIERAEKRADKILDDAKIEAEKETYLAKKNAEDLLSQSKLNADKMIADALEQSKNIKEQTDLADLLKEIEEKKSELDRINEIIQTSRENLKSLELKNAEFLVLDEKNTSLELNIKTLENQKNNLIENQKDIESKILVSTQELEKVNKEKDYISAIASDTDLKYKSITQEINIKQKELDKLTELKDKLNLEVSELDQKKSELETLNHSLKAVQQSVEAKNSEFKNILIEIQNSNTDLKNLKDHQISLNSENTKQQIQIDSEKNNIARLQKEYEDFLNKKNILTSEIEETIKNKDLLIHELNELKGKVVTIEKECAQKIKKSNDEAELIISQSKAKAQSEYIAIIQKSKQDLIDKEENLLAHAKKQAAEILEKSKVEASKMESNSKAHAEELNLKTEQKIEKLLKESQQRSDEIRDRAEAEYRKLIKQAEVESDQIKVNSLQSMESKKQDFIELEKKRMKKSAELLKSELSVLLYSKLKLYLKEDSDEYSARVKSSLETAVNSSMLNEVLDNDDEMYALLDDQVKKQQQKTINYWRYTVPGAIASLAAIYFLGPVFKEKFKDHSRKVASVSKQESKDRIKRIEEQSKADLFEFFNPKQTDEFKDTYTDRVLYTKNYAELSLQKDYREDWILELQNFFVDDLNLSENALVPFISQEANMIRELIAQSKKINGKFVDQGIARMRTIEDDFLVKLKSNLKSDKDYKKIIEFQKRFFNKRVKQI